MTAATIQLTGTDSAGNAQTEDIDVSAGNGTYYATKYFKTLTKSQVTVFTKSDSGSFSYVVTQGQWGVVWKQATNQFAFNCKLLIGDYSATTWLVDINKEVIFSSTSVTSGGRLIEVAANAHFRLGVLEDAANKITSQGCTIISLESIYHKIIMNYYATTTVELYSSSFYDPNTPSGDAPFNIESGGGLKVYHCILSHIHFAYCYNAELYDNYVSGDYAGVEICTGTFDANTLEANQYGIVGFSSYGFTFSNGKIQGSTIADIRPYQITVDLYLVNVESVWTFAWVPTSTAKVYRQYEFDLAVTDVAGAAIASATVTLKDKDGNVVFTTTTDALGVIATQTVSRGYYNQANGNTLQEYSPHTLTISKAGYVTYTEIFTLSAKTAWTISLLAELSGTADIDDVIIGETFYKNAYASKLTGTLALTGDAIEADVTISKTFYNTDPKTMKTGTYVAPAPEAPSQVIIREIEKDPLTEPALMATAVLLLQNKRLKRQRELHEQTTFHRATHTTSC
jgi:hypothetical protein